MMRLARTVAIAAAVGVLVLAASPARAQAPSPQFTKAFNDGVTAFNKGILSGNFDPASKLFLKAIQFDDRFPGPYRYLTLIAKNEKKYEECLDWAFKAVKANPQGKNAPEVRKLHADCRSALNRPVFRDEFAGGGAIAVTTPGVDNAEVKLNGLTYGATPLVRGFAVGGIDVTVSKKGYLPGSAHAEILEGLVTDVIIPLKEDPNAKQADQTNGDELPTGKGVGWIELVVHPDDAMVTVDGKPAPHDDKGRIETEPGEHTMEVDAPGHERWRRRVRFARGQSRRIDVVLRKTATRHALRRKGYLALGAATALTAVGAVFGVLERKQYEKARDIWDTETQRPAGINDQTSTVEPIHTRQNLQKVVDKGRRYELISGVSYGLAAAALGVSIYYFVQERPVERAGYPLPVAVTPVRGADGKLGAQVTVDKVIHW